MRLWWGRFLEGAWLRTKMCVSACVRHHKPVFNSGSPASPSE